MADFDPEFELITKRANEKHEREVYDAYHHTLAGLETGYLLKTFLKKAKLEAKQFEQLYRQMLSDLLRDPVYAKLHRDTNNLLNQAKELTQTALEKVSAELLEAESEYKEILKNASKLDDKAVFIDKDGKVRTEDGIIIEGEDLNRIEWNSNAVSYEQYVQSKNRFEKLTRQKEELEHYQDTVLIPIEGRLNSQTNAFDENEIRDAHNRIYNQAPALIGSRLQPDTPVSAKTHQEQSFKSDKPDLSF